MQFSAADIDSILSVVGVDAILTPELEIPKTIRVKFRRTGIDMMGMLTDRPQATGKESDFDGIEYKTATLEVAAVSYRISKPKPDDAGFVTIDLTRA